MRKPYIIKRNNFYVFSYNHYNKHLIHIPSINAWIFFAIVSKWHTVPIFKKHSNQLMEYLTNENNG